MIRSSVPTRYLSYPIDNILSTIRTSRFIDIFIHNTYISVYLIYVASGQIIFASPQFPFCQWAKNQLSFILFSISLFGIISYIAFMNNSSDFFITSPEKVISGHPRFLATIWRWWWRTNGLNVFISSNCINSCMQHGMSSRAALRLICIMQLRSSCDFDPDLSRSSCMLRCVVTRQTWWCIIHYPSLSKIRYKRKRFCQKMSFWSSLTSGDQNINLN